MRLHRTTARLTISLVLAGMAAASAYAQEQPASARGASVTAKQLLFPVVGKTHYIDDFGAPRGQGGHEGTDIMGDWRAPLVAVEAGRIKLWTSSARAGCMLYLHGVSGTTYLYIHLNNDLTPRKDNRGGCKPGVAFAPGLTDGQKVAAGQLLGFIGDSGDAAGLHPHVHFEVHPGDGGAVSPFPYLQKAAHPLFPISPSLTRLKAPVPITLDGVVKEVRTLASGEQRLVLAAETVLVPGERRLPVKRLVSLGYLGADLQPPGSKVRVVTQPVELNTASQLAKPGVLSVDRVLPR